MRSQQYDLDFRVTEITTSKGSSFVQNLSLAYDQANNITAITNGLDAAKNQTFGYDPDYRLTQASGIYGSLGYSYDVDGNRLSAVANGVTNLYVYPSDRNRLASVTSPSDSRSFVYDGGGNLITDSGSPAALVSYGYGNRNRLKTLTVSGTLKASYLYNAVGERMSKTVDGITTHFHYDQQHRLIAESDGTTGKMLREYVWLDDMPLAQIESDGTIYFIHPDHLNTSQKLTDASETTVWDREQLPFGETFLIAGSASPPALSFPALDAQGKFGFTVTGSSGTAYVVQVSADPTTTSWVSVATNTAPFIFSESDVPVSQARFYRAVAVTSGSTSVVTHNLRFPGQYFDVESGLNYNLMRDYDPSLGRYTEVDPSRSIAFNDTYAYAESNPMRFIDRSGLSPLSVVEESLKAASSDIYSPPENDISAIKTLGESITTTGAAVFAKELFARASPILALRVAGYSAIEDGIPIGWATVVGYYAGKKIVYPLFKGVYNRCDPNGYEAFLERHIDWGNRLISERNMLEQYLATHGQPFFR